MRHLLGLFAIAILVTSPSIAETLITDYDVKASWKAARVYVPDSFFPTSPEKVEITAPKKVVVFMHGCDGINAGAIEWAKFITSLGFIAVLPDSLSIPQRPVNCDSRTKQANLGLVPVRKLRPAEGALAYSEVLKMPWADKNNIFLMGHSEGGMAAALTREDGYAGRIISGYKCQRGGIKAEREKPVLVINWGADPWFDSGGKSVGQCSDRSFWNKRTNATQVILAGGGHTTAYETAAKQAVQDFLGRYSK
jgi:dienelactone hydrolase